eukprot:1951426-Rhodomonas_salina.1
MQKQGSHSEYRQRMRDAPPPPPLLFLLSALPCPDRLWSTTPKQEPEGSGQCRTLMVFGRASLTSSSCAARRL